MPSKTRESAVRLRSRFTYLVAAVVVAASTIYVAWSIVVQDAAADQAALLEARTIDLQMQAAWRYIGGIQDEINYDADGSYNFKGIYCATAAKRIAKDFTDSSSDYAIRYVRNNPRNPEDEPDAFETEALQAFRNSGTTEYYGKDVVNGQPVFRYVSLLTVEKSCLSCHGEPAGSRDETGSYREGFKEGGIAGAASIVVPLSAHREEALAKSVLTIAFFSIMLAVTIVLVRWALKKWVIDPADETNARLEEDNAAKTDFLTLVSHELKTPLSSIIAFADIWQSSEKERPPDEQYLVEEVRDISKVLLGMVNNIIDMARVESGKYKTSAEEVDIVDIMNAVKATADPLAIKKGISLWFEAMPGIPIVLTDWEAVRKILTNLVGNALKFTDAGGSVTVSAKTDAAGTLTVEVSDTGCGIAQEDLALIFDRFGQASSTHPEGEQGSGLGLSLSRQLAAMIGATLEVTSQPGEGSTFSLRFPVSANAPHKD